jgi:hypothetical protein
MPSLAQQQLEALDRSSAYLRRLCEVLAPLPKVLGIGITDMIGESLGSEIPSDSTNLSTRNRRFEPMAKYILNRQHFAPVPMGKGVERQEFVVTEDGAEILRADVAFDSASGMQPPLEQLPKYWAREGAAIVKTVTYFGAGGIATDPFTQSVTQTDEFTAPLPKPVDLGVAEQIDERESETRPTV